jgi:O-antigen ligase
MAQFFSRFGLTLSIVTALLVVANQYDALKNLSPYYRLHTPALCLVFGLIIACYSKRLTVMGLVFALPLLPTFSWQFQLYTGYGRIQDVHAAGLDLVAGILLGTVLCAVFKQRQPLRNQLSLPWPAGLAMIVISVSVAVAIARNLQQSAAPFSGQALLFNLLHVRTLTWHDDYRPLMDWVAYGGAFLTLAVLIPALKGIQDRNDVIFKPLIAGLVIAALVGWRQSAFGAGLSVDLQNFRLDRFGFAALGFQPDLHAFAGHMLLGVLGLLGYVYYKKSAWWRLVLIAGVIPLCWTLLFLSKSKASLALAVLCLGLLALVWMVKRWAPSRYILGGLATVGLLVLLSMPIFPGLWGTALTNLTQALGLPDLFALNIRLSYRPEVYLAALRMFALFPFAGLGQAEFYRQSANPELSQSFFLSIEQNGENAHNYFLQTLVENGVLGFAVFALMLAYPVLKVTDRRLLVPALAALGAIFCGNMFSHSLLVRENLLLAACFVALLYSFVPAVAEDATNHRAKLNWFDFLQKRYVVIGITCISIAFVIKEGLQSKGNFPFNQDLQCFKERPLYRDGWTSGRYNIDMPVGSTGLTIKLATTQPDALQRPLTATINVLFDQRPLMQREFVLNKTGPQELALDLPTGTAATPDDYRIELKVSRCFVPRNFGMNEDSRRLGVRIDAIHWH